MIMSSLGSHSPGSRSNPKLFVGQTDRTKEIQKTDSKLLGGLQLEPEELTTTTTK